MSGVRFYYERCRYWVCAFIIEMLCKWAIGVMHYNIIIITHTHLCEGTLNNTHLSNNCSTVVIRIPYLLYVPYTHDISP